MAKSLYSPILRTSLLFKMSSKSSSSISKWCRIMKGVVISSSRRLSLYWACSSMVERKLDKLKTEVQFLSCPPLMIITCLPPGVSGQFSLHRVIIFLVSSDHRRSVSQADDYAIFCFWRMKPASAHCTRTLNTRIKGKRFYQIMFSLSMTLCFLCQ